MTLAPMHTPPDGTALAASAPDNGVQIAIIDDDPAFGRAVRRSLGRRGYMVHGFSSFKEALESPALLRFEAILLDVDLGAESGVQVCAVLRNIGVSAPIVMLSGIPDSCVKRQALNAGADDYVTKPCDFDEVAARIEAHRRRATPAKDSDLEFGVIRLDPRGRCAWVEGACKQLTELRYLVLAELVRLKGRSMTYDQVNAVQGGPRSPQSTRGLIHELRGAIGCNQDLIIKTRDGWALSPRAQRRVSGVQAAVKRPRSSGKPPSK